MPQFGIEKPRSNVFSIDPSQVIRAMSGCRYGTELYAGMSLRSRSPFIQRFVVCSFRFVLYNAIHASAHWSLIMNRTACFLVTTIAFFGVNLSNVAHADNAGVDEVSLKNGGMLRGTIIALEPDKQVILLLAPTKESRTIPWTDVDKVERGKYAQTSPSAPTPTPPPAPASAPTPATPAAPPGPGALRIHIETNHPGIALQRVGDAVRLTTFEGTTYAVGITDDVAVANEVRCSAPCDRIINAHSGDDFQFTGDGLNPSDKFQLDNQHGEIVAHVSAVGSNRMAGGMSLLFGSLFTGIAGAMVINGSLPSNASDPQSANSLSVGGLVTGIGLVGITAAAVISGIYFVATGHTTYTLRPKGSSSTAASLTPRFSGLTLSF